MRSGKVVLGVLAGVAAGAILGILFAPEKGTITRKKICDKSGDYSDAMKDKFNEFIDTVSEKYNKARENVSDFIEPDKTKVKES